ISVVAAEDLPGGDDKDAEAVRVARQLGGQRQAVAIRVLHRVGTIDVVQRGNVGMRWRHRTRLEPSRSLDVLRVQLRVRRRRGDDNGDHTRETCTPGSRDSSHGTVLSSSRRKGPAGRTRATSSPAIGVRNDSLPCNELRGSIGGPPCDSPRESATSRGMGEARGGGANGVHNEGTKRTEANEEES